MKPSAAHKFGAYGDSSKGEGHPVLFSFKAATDFEPFGDGGGYPKGFLELAMQTLGCQDKTKILHLCSGSMRSGMTVDIRQSRKPSVVADCRMTPFRDGSFQWIMSDPPYSEEYAKNLYGTEKVYPKPGQIVREALRLLKPGGRFGILHFLVPLGVKPLKMIGVYGITTGAGYAIRAWTVFEKGGDMPLFATA